jgi:hypothetical protein
MIPSLSDLAQMNSHALRGAIDAIDERLNTLHYADDGSLRQQSDDESDEFSRLMNLRSRAEQTLRGREQMERFPHSLQHSLSGDRPTDTTRVQDDGEQPLIRLSDGRPAAVARSQSFGAIR